MYCVCTSKVDVRATKAPDVLVRTTLVLQSRLSSHWTSGPLRCAAFVLRKSTFKPFQATRAPDVIGATHLYVLQDVDFRATRAPDVLHKHQNIPKATTASRVANTEVQRRRQLLIARMATSMRAALRRERDLCRDAKKRRQFCISRTQTSKTTTVSHFGDPICSKTDDSFAFREHRRPKDTTFARMATSMCTSKVAARSEPIQLPLPAKFSGHGAMQALKNCPRFPIRK